MIKNLRNKKKKGFTLIELVVVIAIIAILAAVLIPQIAGFTDDAKETAVIADAKEIVTAAESINAKKSTFTDASTWTTIKADSEVIRYMDGNPDTAIKKIAGDVTLGQMKGLMDGTMKWTDTTGSKNDIAETGEIVAAATS